MNKFILNKTPYIALFILGTLLTAAMCSFTKQHAEYDGLVVITHKNNKTLTLTKKEFEKIIFGEKQSWKQGGVVYISLLKSSNTVGAKVVSTVFKMTSNEFNKYWLGLSFEGKCKAPNFSSSEAEVINYVSSTPGAVAIVSTDADISKVSKITISK